MTGGPGQESQAISALFRGLSRVYCKMFLHWIAMAKRAETRSANPDPAGARNLHSTLHRTSQWNASQAQGDMHGTGALEAKTQSD